MSFIHPLGIAIAQSNKSPRRVVPVTDSSGDFDKLKEERCLDPSSALWKVFMTAIYCGCFFCFGTTMAILGPTLIELGRIVHRGLNQMSWLFFTQASYALFGASFAGIVIDRYSCNCDVMLLVALLLNGVFLTLIPICRTLWLLIIATAAAGFCVGVLDTGANVQLLTLHGKEVSPYLQALYFSYGFGAFVSPLIAEPFLSGQPHPDIGLPARRSNPQVHEGGTKHGLVHKPTVKLPTSPVTGVDFEKSEVQFAYWIIAMSHIPVVLGLAYLVISEKWEQHKRRRAFEKEERLAKEQAGQHSNDLDVRIREKDEQEKCYKPASPWSSPHRTQIICVTAWTALLVFLYDGMQVRNHSIRFSYNKLNEKIKPSDLENCFETQNNSQHGI